MIPSIRRSRGVAAVVVANLAMACSQGSLVPRSAEEAYSSLHGESGIDSGKSYEDIIKGGKGGPDPEKSAFGAPPANGPFRGRAEMS